MAPVNLIKERELTAARLRELLSYDPETGIFRWSQERRRRVMAGDIAGTTSHRRGYRIICLDYRKYLAHRLAWLYVYGEWPQGEIDHINGYTDNNSIGNLRLASRQQNNWNKRAVRSDSKLGIRNIVPRGKSFRVQILSGRKRVYLKTFKTLEKAIAMRDVQLAALRGTFSPEIREGS